MRGADCLLRARDNPFRSERMDRLRYRLQGTTWPDLLERCERLNYRCAVVGPVGSGKTTFLEELERVLAAAGFRTRLFRLRQKAPPFAAGFLCGIARNEIVLLDSAGQLNYAQWCRVQWRCRCARGLVITTHNP